MARGGLYTSLAIVNVAGPGRLYVLRNTLSYEVKEVAVTRPEQQIVQVKIKTKRSSVIDEIFGKVCEDKPKHKSRWNL